jgi:thioredoxin 1
MFFFLPQKMRMSSMQALNKNKMAQMVTDSDFEAEVLNSSDVVLVDFFATWCGPCQALVPVLEELSKEMPAGSKVVKVDVDQAPEASAKYGVMSIPTLKVFKGGEMVEETSGLQSKEALLAMVGKHV